MLGNGKSQNIRISYVCGNQGLCCLGLSPVCHQHLDDKVGEKNQEGAGCVVFEGRECRESILEGKGGVETMLSATLKVSIPGKEWSPSLTAPPFSSVPGTPTVLQGPVLLPASPLSTSVHRVIFLLERGTSLSPPGSQTEQTWGGEVGPLDLAPPQGQRTKAGRCSGANFPAPHQPTSFSISFSLKYSVSGLKSFDCFHCLVGGGGNDPRRGKSRAGVGGQVCFPGLEQGSPSLSSRSSQSAVPPLPQQPRASLPTTHTPSPFPSFFILLRVELFNDLEELGIPSVQVII